MYYNMVRSVTCNVTPKNTAAHIYWPLIMPSGSLCIGGRAGPDPTPIAPLNLDIIKSMISYWFSLSFSSSCKHQRRDRIIGLISGNCELSPLVPGYIEMSEGTKRIVGLLLMLSDNSLNCFMLLLNPWDGDQRIWSIWSWFKNVDRFAVGAYLKLHRLVMIELCHHG